MDWLIPFYLGGVVASGFWIALMFARDGAMPQGWRGWVEVATGLFGWPSLPVIYAYTRWRDR